METGKKTYTVKIQPLTCVHIGSGAALNPLDYMLKSITIKSGEKTIYAKYSSEKMLNSLVKANDKNALAEFERMTSESDFRKLQKFFHSHFTFDSLEYPCDVTKEFKNLYSSKISDGAWENALEMFQMYRPAGKRSPVIPGSSIKGAVRTAVLNYILLEEMGDEEYGQLKEMADERKEKDFKKKGDYEKEIQNAALQIHKGGKGNDAQKDPFRCVEFSDATFSSKTQLVGCLKNVAISSQNGLIPTTMQMIAETIPGSLAHYESDTTIALRINEGLQENRQLRDFSINKAISRKYMMKACNYFFKRQFKNEYEKFYKDAYEGVDEIVELKKIIDALDENDESKFLLRVGRWSQVEYVTLGNDFRNPKTPNRRGRETSYGATRTLFDLDGQYLPLGWCLCTVE